jgi:two-component system NtrC family sensor kinase
MRVKLQTRVFLTFVLTVALFAVICAVVGAWLITDRVYMEAQRRVQIDVRGAWAALEAMRTEIRQLAGALVAVGQVQVNGNLVASGECRHELEAIRRLGRLDFVGITDGAGRVLARGVEPYTSGDDLSDDPLIYRALRGEEVTGFVILGAQRLQAEGRDLDRRAFVAFEPTPKAKPSAKESESAGMALMAAVPVFDQRQTVVAVAYCGVLLNRNYPLVDRIRSTVFADRTYEGRQFGTVTIFQWDVRVATNVVKSDGNRAVGTRVSGSVYDRVLENDASFYDKAFVVNDWYISAYDPIHDVNGEVIGILYVGVLAKEYEDIRAQLWLLYGALSVFAALLVIGVGYVFSRRLTRSLGRLAQGADSLAKGDLDLTVPEPDADDEILDLTRDFNAMSASLRDRDERLRNANARLAEANAQLQRVNENYLDMLGFVSHELKNTLGVIYTASHSLDAGLVGPLNEAQGRLARSISRSIRNAVTMTRNYLDLSRIEKGELAVDARELDFTRDVAAPVIADFAQAAHDKNVAIVSELPDSLPLQGDVDLLRVVYKNLIDNALKYGREGGTIRLRAAPEDGTCKFEVWNEGNAPPAVQIERLFQKFARLDTDSEAGRKGTGLGLFITKEIVTKHGGTVWAESEQGHWMNFLFVLPLKA